MYVKGKQEINADDVMKNVAVTLISKIIISKNFQTFMTR